MLGSSCHNRLLLIQSMLLGRTEGIVVLDGFCGCGGNIIAFAARQEVSTVVCVDVDRAKLEMAANNAMIYNIPTEKLIFIQSNTKSLLESYAKPSNQCCGEQADDHELLHGFKLGGPSLLPKNFDAAFLSPPWGGTDYEGVGKYRIESCMVLKAEDGSPWHGEQLLEDVLSTLKSVVVALFLPRNTDGTALARSALKAGYTGDFELEQNLLHGKLKTVTAYLQTSSEE